MAIQERPEKMATAFASKIIRAPIEAVWKIVRDFNGLPRWNPSIVESRIEDGQPSDLVGCIRAVKLDNGSPGRERLLTLDDRNYRLSYNFETPPLPVFNYVGTLELRALTPVDHTLAIWRSTFDEAPEDMGRYSPILSEQVFASGLASLEAQLAQAGVPIGAGHWAEDPPNKVYCATLLNAPLNKSWAIVRAFAGSAELLPNLKRSDNAQPWKGRVGETRQCWLGDELLHEQLIALSDIEHTLSFELQRSTSPALYRAHIELLPITADDTCLAICTADWACSQDDVGKLGLNKHHNTLLRALGHLNNMIQS